MRRLTVLIADDHAIVREGIISLLKDHNFDVVGTVGDGAALLEAAQRLRPDLIVTDISMPGMSGLEALTRLTAENLPSKIILLTMHDDPELATRAVRAGASGFVLKEGAAEELTTAIDQVIRGRLYLTPAVTRQVLERMADPEERTGPQLSPRQLEVLRLLVLGRRTKEIAAALDLSPRTVETHKYQVMDTLGVSSTAELVRYAIEHKLLEN
jgi:DNA-binding NarL/FixJ family response regulator